MSCLQAPLELRPCLPWGDNPAGAATCIQARDCEINKWRPRGALGLIGFVTHMDSLARIQIGHSTGSPPLITIVLSAPLFGGDT
jgi:hypothetical protein